MIEPSEGNKQGRDFVHLHIHISISSISSSLEPDTAVLTKNTNLFSSKVLGLSIHISQNIAKTTCKFK